MPADVAIIIKACKTVITLKNLLESGELSEMMTNVELRAAKEALRKSVIARNPTYQVLSALNHLESAHQHCLESYQDGLKIYHGWVTKEKIIVRSFLDRWCLFLMAVCYKYLGERELFIETIEKGKKIDPQVNNFNVGDVFALFQLVDPRWLTIKSDDIPYIHDVTFDALKKTY